MRLVMAGITPAERIQKRRNSKTRRTIMKNHFNENRMMILKQVSRRLRLFISAALLTLVCLPSLAETHFQQVNLVSDLPGVAQLQDTNLVNAWGIAFSATSPFWVSDNGTGKATLYVVTND